MKFGEVQRFFRKVQTNIKYSYEVLKFFDNFDTFIMYHNILLEVYFIYAHKNNYHYNFLVEFRNFPTKQTFFLCFHQLTKPTTFRPAVITKPLFAQKKILGLILVQCIGFIFDFFPWLYI